MFPLRKLFAIGFVALATASTAWAQVPGVVPNPVTVSPPISASLAGSEWTGHENLQSFGALTFRFQDQSKVFMIDTQGQWPGDYTQNGPNVALVFFKGSVQYRGQIAGSTMSGTAENKAGGRWEFQVKRNGALAVAPSVPTTIPAATNAPVNQGPPVGPVAITTPPANTIPPGIATNPGIIPQAQNKLTPETLPEYLRKMGFEPRVVRPEAGTPYCVLEIKENDGWTFVVEAQVKNGLFLTAPLTPIVARDAVPASRILQLLEANQGLAPCFFSFRAADNRICLRLELIGSQPSQQNFRTDLRLLLNSIRRSHALWNPANFQPAVQTATFTPTQP